MPKYEIITCRKRTWSAPRRATPVPEQISEFRHQMRVQFWREFLPCSAIPPILYGLNETHPSQEKDDEQEVFIPRRADA